MEYAMTVWNFALTKEQQAKLERQEKIATRMMGIRLTEGQNLRERHEKTCLEKYAKIEKSEQSILQTFICQRLQRSGQYRLHKVTTSRFQNSFFVKTPALLNQYKM